MESDPKRRMWHTLAIATCFSGFSYLFTFHKSFRSWVTGWLRWTPTSYDFLEQAEKKILSYVQKPVALQFFEIPSFDQIKEESIRTIIIHDESSKNSTPLVLLHGFASGIGLWILNLDHVSENRTVYAPDLLGFGRSSRPQFSRDAELAENQYVESIEQWRKQVKLDKFILMGHSMGGFLAASYAIKYPHRIKHLILADPWGFPVEQDSSVKRIKIPIWVKAIALLLRPFNPLAGLRAAGPWGPKLVERLRPDILGKFYNYVEDTSDVSNYIYHCNAQNPSGEAAFKAMTAQFGMAKRPMIKRISEIRRDVAITFIYGSRSWIDSYSGVQTAALRPDSSVEVKIIQGAGHHVYADRASEFNAIVCNTCNKVDQKAYVCLHKYIPSENNTHEDEDNAEAALPL